MIAIGINIFNRRGGGSSGPLPDALFDTRTGLTITDSIGGLSATVKSFPVADWRTTKGATYAMYNYTTEPPIITSGDYTFVIIMRNENSDTIDARVSAYDINGSGCTLDPLLMRSGPLYVSNIILHLPSPLLYNANPGKVVSQSEPWVCAVRFDSATNTLQPVLNGTQIDTGTLAAAALGLGTSNLYFKMAANYTNARFFGAWVFDRLLSDAEILGIYNGNFPAYIPSRQFIHNNYGDNISKRFLSSHARHICNFLSSGTIAAYPDDVTHWTSRYDNEVFAYSLKYGYTRAGMSKIPYAPTSVKLMPDEGGDIEHPSSDCIHNMAESLIDFEAGTAGDATINAIFDKSNRTYWKATIESTAYYALGVYKWHPSELQRDFITIHAETGHENHIFASLRTSGIVTTGITALRVFKTNLT